MAEQESIAGTATANVPQAALPIFSQGLYTTLAPAIEHCDTSIRAVYASQQQLATHIDSLHLALQTFTTTSRLPSLQPYSTKLQSCKKRLKRLQSNVDRMNSRMEEMRSTIRRKEGIPSSSSIPSSRKSVSVTKDATQSIIEPENSSESIRGDSAEALKEANEMHLKTLSVAELLNWEDS